MPKWFKLDRPISRGSYFIAGLLLFVLKHNLDRLIAIAYKRPWGVFSYLCRSRGRRTYPRCRLTRSVSWGLVTNGHSHCCGGCLADICGGCHIHWVIGMVVAVFFVPILNLAFVWLFEFNAVANNPLVMLVENQ